MIVSAPKFINPQRWLWDSPNDRDITSVGVSRSFVGEFYELATVAMCPGAVQLRTDCTADICPDVWHGRKTYSETKSVGPTSQGMIYDWRHVKYTYFFELGNELFYWFWNHSAKPNQSETLQEMYADLASKTFRVAIVSHLTLNKYLRCRLTSMLNYQYGKGRKGKKNGMGYRFPINDIFDICGGCRGTHQFKVETSPHPLPTREHRVEVSVYMDIFTREKNFYE